MDPGDPALPVAGRGVLAGVRRSRNARRRAWVLLAVHLLIAAHVAHYLVAGRTISPVEPSESMYTLELGQLNAGFVFLCAALLATLLFGRFFCGWGCHLVALQDLCGWLMKRLGVRPRPFRSRLLLWGPAAIAFYMFAWPTLKRLGERLLVDRGWLAGAAGPSWPALTNHLTTDAFWRTFPGPLFTVATFAVCGFGAVYLLGAKGFCTYGCPYGALFGAVDRAAPLRIVVSDACEQCGHCTATCTSNVRVHDEVRRYGRVVDPGCMKCMDCVSVCPKGALRLGLARPALFSRRSTAGPGPRRYPLPAGAELALGGVTLVAALAYRGLYDGPPLLLSMGLGAITAFVAWKLAQLARRPGVRLQSATLKSAGAMTRGGRLFAVLGTLWLALTAHSAFVQWHRAWGRYELNRTEASRADALSGVSARRTYSEAHARAARATLRHFSLADRWGLADVLEVKLGLAWAHLLRGEDAAAERALRAASELAPRRADLQRYLADFLTARGRLEEAADVLETLAADAAAGAGDQFRLAGLLVEAGRPERAVEHFRAAVSLAPDSAAAHYGLGGVLRRLGRPAEALPALEAAARLDPDDRDTQVELGLACMAVGRNAEARQALERAIRLAPDHPESRLHLPNLLRELESSEGNARGAGPP